MEQAAIKEGKKDFKPKVREVDVAKAKIELLGFSLKNRKEDLQKVVERLEPLLRYGTFHGSNQWKVIHGFLEVLHERVQWLEGGLDIQQRETQHGLHKHRIDEIDSLAAMLLGLIKRHGEELPEFGRERLEGYGAGLKKELKTCLEEISIGMSKCNLQHLLIWVPRTLETLIKILVLLRGEDDLREKLLQNSLKLGNEAKSYVYARFGRIKQGEPIPLLNSGAISKDTCGIFANLFYWCEATNHLGPNPSQETPGASELKRASSEGRLEEEGAESSSSLPIKGDANIFLADFGLYGLYPVIKDICWLVSRFQNGHWYKKPERDPPGKANAGGSTTGGKK